jgi:hypothetical protein
MIAWYWLILAFVLGEFFGFFVAALLSAAHDYRE